MLVINIFYYIFSNIYLGDTGQGSDIKSTYSKMAIKTNNYDQ